MSKIVLGASYEKFQVTEAKRLNKEAEAQGRTLKEATVTKRVARNFMRDVVANKDNLELIPEIKEALITLFGSTRSAGGSSPKAVIRKAVQDMLKENGAVSESDVFSKSMEIGAAWGRAEMRRFIKDSINTDPETRMWVEFQAGTDGPMGQYVMVAQGADAPDGWKGYIPSDTAIDL